MRLKQPQGNVNNMNRQHESSNYLRTAHAIKMVVEAWKRAYQATHSKPPSHHTVHRYAWKLQNLLGDPSPEYAISRSLRVHEALTGCTTCRPLWENGDVSRNHFTP